MIHLTSENIILIILIRFSTNLYQTFQTIIAHKSMNKIFVILQQEKRKCTKKRLRNVTTITMIK